MKRINPFSRMMAAFGLIAAPLVSGLAEHAHVHNVARLPRGPPRRKLITKKQRRHKRAIQAASRHINRSQQRRHPS